MMEREEGDVDSFQKKDKWLVNISKTNDLSFLIMQIKSV